VPCERQYCENNGNCVEENRSLGILSRAKCQCLEYCTQSYSPVCGNDSFIIETKERYRQVLKNNESFFYLTIGSNGETFPNDCQLRLLSCRRGFNYFVRFPNSCETGRRTRDIQTAFLTQISI
jgi:hypothetical protein